MSLIDFDREMIAQGYPVIAGADEAGRGPLAGPVFACAVIMRDDEIIDEVNDSKKLTEKKRETLYAVSYTHLDIAEIIYYYNKSVKDINFTQIV